MSLPLLQIRDATKVYSSGGFLGTSQKSVVALDNFNMTIGGSPATITTIAGEAAAAKRRSRTSCSALSDLHRATSSSMAKILPI